jgi:hypothetical protein
MSDQHLQRGLLKARALDEGMSEALFERWLFAENVALGCAPWDALKQADRYREVLSAMLAFVRGRPAEQRRSTAHLYDSRVDTYQHIDVVRGYLNDVIMELIARGERHDQSKLQSPEREAFDEFTPKLKELTYGSDEYKATLDAMSGALHHHYAANSHHPEHFGKGIDEMTLLDLIEMVCDWKAATERHDDGDIRRSLQVNAERFGIGKQLRSILLATIEERGWLEPKTPLRKVGTREELHEVRSLGTVDGQAGVWKLVCCCGWESLERESAAGVEVEYGHHRRHVLGLP